MRPVSGPPPTSATLPSTRGIKGGVFISPGDTDILRRLASRLAQLAARPSEAGKRELWYQHNALTSRRPLVLVDPENGWNEIVRLDSLQDDRPLEALFEVG